MPASPRGLKKSHAREAMELNEGLLTPNSPGSLIEIEEQKAGIRPAWSLSRPNPYSTLSDIVSEQAGDYDAESDTLTLFTADGNTGVPKVSNVLNKLVKFPGGENPNEEVLSAQESMLALLKKAPVKLDTLAGVYLPTIQNIFGVILFLRVPWIVGTAGVGQALLIVAICCTTTLLTALSLSAIATNGVVPAGGAYFMISRNLGPEFGGAVGILFYLGTTFAGAMYILGAIELLLVYIAPGMSAFGPGPVDPDSVDFVNNLRLYGSAVLMMLVIVVFIGVKYVNRFGGVCLFAVILSILCIFIGFFSTPFAGQPDVCLAGQGLMESDEAGDCTQEYLRSVFDWVTNTTSVERIQGFPGLTSDVGSQNAKSTYLGQGEVAHGVDGFKGQVAETSESTSFAILLAIFFPSVTGIMAGSNRSGDLKDPSASIPTGTIAAVMTTSMVYFCSVILLGATTEGTVLRDKFGESIGGRMVLAQLSWPTEWIVLIGALLSCLGAALQSLTGAPRLLQAIAQDDLIKALEFFGKASESGEPTRALILTACIAEAGILIASLDTVAPIITMFFLMCYAFVNLACAIQSLLKSPSWRPRYKYYHWSLSATGMVMCVLLMLISSWVYAVVAMMFAGVIYHYIQYRGAAKEWGDGLRGLSMQAAKFSLLRLEETPPHTKNWRPQVLAFARLEVSDGSTKLLEPSLVHLAGQLKGGKGLTMIASVLLGRYQDRWQEAAAGQKTLKRALKTASADGFAQVMVGSDIESAVTYLIQGSGLGALRHNTVILGWPHRWRTQHSASILLQAMSVSRSANLAFMVPKYESATPSESNPARNSIDVWWIMHDGGMLILIAFLLRQDKAWSRCRLRIFCVAEADDNSIQMEQDLALFVRLLRIDAEVFVVEMVNSDITPHTVSRAREFEESRAAAYGTPLASPSQTSLRRMNTATKMNAVLTERSKDADLVALCLPDPLEDDDPLEYMTLLEELTVGLNRVLFIRGGGREVITIFS
eukprot:m.68425 g.68425  ORF g.68425 m.68425 type:complete len:994 (+) comp9919_c0_seq2:60-3041(+)